MIRTLDPLHSIIVAELGIDTDPFILHLFAALCEIGVVVEAPWLEDGSENQDQE